MQISNWIGSEFKAKYTSWNFRLFGAAVDLSWGQGREQWQEQWQERTKLQRKFLKWIWTCIISNRFYGREKLDFYLSKKIATVNVLTTRRDGQRDTVTYRYTYPLLILVQVKNNFASSFSLPTVFRSRQLNLKQGWLLAGPLIWSITALKTNVSASVSLHAVLSWWP